MKVISKWKGKDLFGKKNMQTLKLLFTEKVKI